MRSAPGLTVSSRLRTHGSRLTPHARRCALTVILYEPAGVSYHSGVSHTHCQSIEASASNSTHSIYPSAYRTHSQCRPYVSYSAHCQSIDAKRKADSGLVAGFGRTCRCTVVLLSLSLYWCTAVVVLVLLLSLRTACCCCCYCPTHKCQHQHPARSPPCPSACWPRKPLSA